MPDAVSERERWSTPSIVTFAIGMLFGAPSLAYPLGSDQALFWYVGRGWLLYGAVPYRDAFDVKPPPIFLVHGLASLISGGGMWGIRLVEWLAMIPIGFLAASLASPDDEKTPKLSLALGVLAANVAHFGFFDFWDTAQCEVWCCLATLGGLYVIFRSKLATIRAAAFSGLLAGVVVLVKPPAAPMALVVFGAFVVRHGSIDKRALAKSIAVFGGASLVPLAVTLLYFAGAGALGDFVDVLVGYNRAYVRDENTKFAGGVLAQIRKDVDNHGVWWVVVHASILLGMIRSRGTARARWFLAFALLAAAMIGIVAQRKFYHYHYGLIVAAHVLAACLAFEVFLRRIRSRATNDGLRAMFAIVAIGTVFGSSIRGARMWSLGARATVAGVLGDRDRLIARYAIHSEDIDWSWRSREQAAAWVREHSEPNDVVLVRGFDPAIYAMANRRYGGRWYCTHHITSPKVFYKRAEWTAQDRADIDRLKPRIVVARVPPDFGPDINDERWFHQLGYRSVERMPPFVLMERIDAP